ncbi:MAG: hypothetical protein ACP5OX_02240, partial [Minisyncoccia bacterium]
KWLCLTIILILAPFVMAITFGKLHDVPLYKLVGSMFRYFWLPRQYVFKKEIIYQGFKTTQPSEQKIPSQPVSQKKQLDRKTLKELSNILDK